MYAGVGLFFVLSGFLITYNYFQASNLSFDFFRKYMARRFAKIYPVYFIITTVYFVYWWLRGEGGQNIEGVYILNITFIRGFSEKFFFSGIFQGWSLTVEETFYLLAPLIFLVIRKGYFFSQILFFILAGCALVLFFRFFPFEGFFANLRFMFNGTFFGRCFEFFAGIALALFMLRFGETKNKGFYFTAAGIIFIFFCLTLMAKTNSFFDSGAGIANYAGRIVHHALLPIGVVMFFYGLITESTLVSRAFASKPIVLLGQASYCFYLVHAGLAAEWMEGVVGSNIILLFITLQLLAFILYFGIENPLNKGIRKILRAWRF